METLGRTAESNIAADYFESYDDLDVSAFWPSWHQAVHEYFCYEWRKIIIFWDVTSYSQIDCYHSFRGVCCFHLQYKRGEVGGSWFPQNIGACLSNCTATHLRRSQSEYCPGNNGDLVFSSPDILGWNLVLESTLNSCLINLFLVVIISLDYIAYTMVYLISFKHTHETKMFWIIITLTGAHISPFLCSGIER